MKKTWLALIGVMSMIAGPVFADAYGFANGRSANLDNLADLSVEGGLAFGDITNIGARVNYKVNPDLMVFGDFASTDFDGGGSGTSFGGGAFYQLRNVTLLENTDFAVKGAYHLGSVDEADYSEISLDAIISGDQLSTTNLGWYGNLGLHMLRVEVDFGFGSASDSETELLIGGGVTGSLSFGDWYAGIDIIDELFFVAGVRYNIQ